MISILTKQVMKHFALIISSFLLFTACNNASKSENKNKSQQTEQKKEEAPLKDITLSFNGIEVGKSIKDIDKSCFTSKVSKNIKSFELIPDFVCSIEKLEKTFYKSIIEGHKNREYVGKVLVYTEKGTDIISKIVYYIPDEGEFTYYDIFDMYMEKYGRIDTNQTFKSMPFETNIYTWKFANNKRIALARRKYIGESYGPYREIARVGIMKNCIEVIYYNCSVQEKGKKIDSEARRIATEKKNKEMQQKRKQQDI